MGRGWVHGVRMAAGAKKGKAFTKIAKEITVAARIGGANPESNPRLRSALKDAQKNSMPKDTVERAIKRGAGGADETNYEEVTYEAYGPHGVAVLVECLTDNRNRTVQDLRALFVRAGGNLGESGSVQWMFDKVGTVTAKIPSKTVDPEEAAIVCGANEVEDFGDGEWSFVTAPEDLDAVSKALVENSWDVQKSELSYKAKTPAELSAEQQSDVQEMLEKLHDNDDVKKIHLSV